MQYKYMRICIYIVDKSQLYMGCVILSNNHHKSLLLVGFDGDSQFMDNPKYHHWVAQLLNSSNHRVSRCIKYIHVYPHVIKRVPYKSSPGHKHP